VGGEKGEGDTDERIDTLTPCLPAGRQPSPVKGEGEIVGAKRR